MDKHEPVGVRVRRNNSIYYPRTLNGFEDLWFYRNAQKYASHILLAGPPGSGKTAGCEAAFDSFAEDEEVDLDKPLGMYTLLGTESTTVDDFVGSYVQNPETGFFDWVHGVLTRSIIDDVPLLVDEIALIDPKVLSILYPLMDGRGILEITQNPSLPPFKVGKNWFVIAAYNPDVPGAFISEALLDRFEHRFEVETDWNLAISMGVSQKLVKACESLNMQRRKGEMSWSPQFRSLMTFKKNEQRYGTDFAIKGLVSKTPSEDRDALINALRNYKVGDVNSYIPLSLGERFKEQSSHSTDFD